MRCVTLSFPLSVMTGEELTDKWWVRYMNVRPNSLASIGPTSTVNWAYEGSRATVSVCYTGTCTRNIGPTLAQCWVNVWDVDPALNQCGASNVTTLQRHVLLFFPYTCCNPMASLLWDASLGLNGIQSFVRQPLCIIYLFSWSHLYKI